MEKRLAFLLLTQMESCGPCSIFRKTVQRDSPKTAARKGVFTLWAAWTPYRGIFLRGHGSQTSTHYGTVTHSSAGLGQLQGDAIREIWGDIPTGAVEEDVPYSGAFGRAQLGMGADGREGEDYGIYFRASWVTPVAQEIRPVNRSVRYLIRTR